MANYREGESVKIHGCNYTIEASYLSAKSNGSYPKVLAKILGIDNIDQFVKGVLGYSRFEGKKFGFDGMEDGNKLINALINFSGVAPKKSGVLNDASVKKFFENDANLERLEGTSSSITDLLANFAAIRKISGNIISKVSTKNNELVQAIDSKDVKGINRLEKELQSITKFVTETNDVLLVLNEMGANSADEVEAFDSETFINGDS